MLVNRFALPGQAVRGPSILVKNSRSSASSGAQQAERDPALIITSCRVLALVEPPAQASGRASFSLPSHEALNGAAVAPVRR